MIRKTFALLLSLLLLLTVMPLVGAQETEDTDDGDLIITIEITGEVSFEDGDLLVGGVIVAPAGAFNPSELEEGMVITVTGVYLNDGVLYATSPYELADDTEIDDEDECPDVNADGVCDEDVDDDDNDDVDDDDIDDDTSETCVPDTHPVANALAAEFDLDVATVIDWHCDGNGFGEIARALLLAEATEDEDDDAETFLEMRGNGMGWGQIVQDSDVHPRDLAPGRVISGNNADDDDDDDDQPQQNAAPNNNPNANNGNGNGNSNGNQGNGNGNSNGNGNQGNGNGNSNGNGNGNSNGNGNGNGRGR